MQHLPKPKDQARILKTAMKDLGLKLKHQDALKIVAKVMGYKDWHTMSAVLQQMLEEKAEERKALTTILGPANGDLYESIVTVDQTFSARIRVRANSPAEARRLLSEAGHTQYPHGFELDEGNYRSVGDFYLGDPDSVQNLSKPEFEVDFDYYACAEWEDEHVHYRLALQRRDADVANEDIRAKTNVTLTVWHEDSGLEEEREKRGYVEVYDELRNYIREAVRDGDFAEDFAKLKQKIMKKLAKKA